MGTLRTSLPSVVLPAGHRSGWEAASLALGTEGCGSCPCPHPAHPAALFRLDGAQQPVSGEAVLRLLCSGEEVDPVLRPAATLEESTAEVRKPRGTAVLGSHRMKTQGGRRRAVGAGPEESLTLATVCGWSRPPEVEGWSLGTLSGQPWPPGAWGRLAS